MNLDHSILKSYASEDVLNFYIKYLGLKQGTINYLKKFRKNQNGIIADRFEVVADIINMDFEDFRDVMSLYKNYVEVEQILYDIQENLASLGVKIKNSDFDSYDVSIDKLELNERLKSRLKKSPMIKTLGDLKNYGSNRLVSLLDFTYAEINQVVEALEKYGVRLEGSKYKIVKENRFPLTKKAKHLSREKTNTTSDEKAKTSTETKTETPSRKPIIIHRIISEKPSEEFNITPTKPTIPQIIKSNSEKQTQNEAKPKTESDEFLSKPISELPISPKFQYYFKFILTDIKTIGDLLSIRKSDLKKRLNNNFTLLKDIENALAKYGYLLKGSKMTIVNGQAIGKRYVKPAKMQKELANQVSESLNEESSNEESNGPRNE